MPSVRYSAQAIADLKRLHDFLAKQEPAAAKRATLAIRTALEKITLMPDRFPPVEGMPNFRQAVIDFGASGYLALFRLSPDGDVTIARIKHQKEDGYA